MDTMATEGVGPVGGGERREFCRRAMRMDSEMPPGAYADTVLAPNRSLTASLGRAGGCCGGGRSADLSR